ncbi:hypothetical protein PANT111_160134 [Pantoea brenneri]|uniref:Uncharacterized protein n=1 Tax=Pantoea brenneri TaxID=472694 RepID=A0AAX3J4B5_9GAMM|nr:hypothetical protein PANT111_160134 [Pantoea brenneri]
MTLQHLKKKLPYLEFSATTPPLQITQLVRLDQNYRSILLFIYTVFINGGFESCHATTKSKMHLSMP